MTAGAREYDQIDRAIHQDVTRWPRWKEGAPYLTFCKDFQVTKNFRSALPTEIYFIRKDDRALLSFCPDEDIFTRDLVDVVPRSLEDEDLWKEMNEKVQRVRRAPRRATAPEPDQVSVPGAHEDAQ